jgi:hypothetical protein
MRQPQLKWVLAKFRASRFRDNGPHDIGGTMSGVTRCSLADFVNAMADETRHGILVLLRGREMSVAY